MEFEFDTAKSASNKKKHGIDFKDAQRLWDSSHIELRSKNPKEERKLIIGQIDDVFWTAIVTNRGGKTRIISVRRSRNEEKEIFQRNHHG